VKKMRNNYSTDAFTGLEAAIVLIAFVVVAAVFSYVVLGAGFFTSQTAQSTVHTGVAQASSSIELVGNVYGIADSNKDHLKYINLTVALTAGGTPVDLSGMVVSYNDNKGGHNSNVAFDQNSTCGPTIAGGSGASQYWCIMQKINNQTTGTMLDNNAQIIIGVGMPDTTTVNTKFTVNFQPAVGAVLPVSRSTPGGYTAIQALY
jgi:flagellin FlaB